jgi:CO/xanthine dehydrogenase Mo-binding subunit
VAPVVEVHLAQKHLAAGRHGRATAANAVFAAIGKRLRKMPIDPNLLEA